MSPTRTHWFSSALSLAATILLAGGCSGGADNNGDGDGCHGGQQLLSIVGNPNKTIYPGEEAKLQVVFLEQCVGALAGEPVSFEITGNAYGSTLDAAKATTGQNGLAGVTLRGGDPGIMDRQFQVWASSPTDTNGVYFSIKLKPVELEISGGGGLQCYVGESLILSATVTDTDSNTPARGASVKFEIKNPPPGGDASLADSVAVTNLSGVASTVFNCGTAATSYQVEASGADEEMQSDTFNIAVLSRQACLVDADCPRGFTCVNGSCRETAGAACQHDDDCDEGYDCIGGYCRPKDSLPGSCDTHEHCPPGYFCENHQCYPCPPDSQIPGCQGGDDCGCYTDADCPPGFKCSDCVCYPDNPPEVVIPELGGTWYSKHYFNLSKAIGGMSTVSIIDKLNKIINYCDITGIGWVDKFLCDLIGEFIPPWVRTLVDIFANLANILSELRAEGKMELVHLNPRELISGTETWDTILIRYLNACCEGKPPGCDPYKQPNFPDCATIDISRKDIGPTDTVFVVKPFTGKVNVDDSGAVTKYTLAIDRRNVEINFSKFMSYIIDLLVKIFTGYDNLDAALKDVIDCQAIQDLVDDLLGSWAPDIRKQCENFKPTAGQLLKSLLDQIAVEWSILKFKGWATVTTTSSPPYGKRLGKADYEKSKDGVWNGDVKIVVSGSVDGAWSAER